VARLAPQAENLKSLQCKILNEQSCVVVIIAGHETYETYAKNISFASRLPREGFVRCTRIQGRIWRRANHRDVRRPDRIYRIGTLLELSSAWAGWAILPAQLRGCFAAG